VRGSAVRPTDHAGLAVLSFAECLELVASEPVGRVAFARDGDIEVLPVNHCVVDQTVAFRTAGGSKFTAAYWGSVVAFEVDSYDAGRHSGWSVLVKGRAERVTDDAMLARLAATGLRTWSPSASRSEWVVIHADEVSGRRL
jgi:uncharacterized protein